MRKRRSLRRKYAVGPRLALLILALVVGMPSGRERGETFVKPAVFVQCNMFPLWILNCAPNSVMFTTVSDNTFPRLKWSSVCLTRVRLTLYLPIFMSLSRLPLTHRGDVTILLFPWLPLTPHIHASPLYGGGSLQHCRRRRLNIKSPRTSWSNSVSNTVCEISWNMMWR